MKIWLAALALATGCSDEDTDRPDGFTGCDPATALPTNYRLIGTISSGTVDVAAAGEVTSGTIDATAGGLMAAADNPYIYVDLKGAAKVDASDVDARGSKAWDIALKRSSLRLNGGDSGSGGRTLAIVPAATLADVTAGPPGDYASDEFANEDCLLASIPGGEPMSAFGEWYGYDTQTHAVTPKAEVYVIERTDGSRTAFRIASYYGDTTNPMRGAFYRVEWKPLPAAP